MQELKKKYGIVIILDALGASSYNDEEIKSFLSTRSEVNQIIRDLEINESIKELYTSLKLSLPNDGLMNKPEIFTFGDTVILTIELNEERFISLHIHFVTLMIARYFFHSFENGILFRGAFSVGEYIENSESNTVMGQAVTDAAAWYDKSDWAGITCTPKTQNILDYYYFSNRKPIDENGYLLIYDVPLKSNKHIRLYTVNWVAPFYSKELLENKTQTGLPEEYFLKKLKGFDIPIGTESKLNFTKEYYYYCKSFEDKREIRFQKENK